MGADIVIAVNVGTPLLKREQLNSIFGVTGQMLSILTEQNVQASLASLKPTDILISPELGDFSTGDFDNLPKIASRSARRRRARWPIGWRHCRLPARRVRGAAPAPARGRAADLRPVDEIRFPRAHAGQSGGGRGDHGDEARASRSTRESSTRHAAPLRHGRLRARELPHHRGAGQAGAVGRCDREDRGARTTCASASACPSDFQGDAYFNLLVELSQDLAQLARRGVAHRFAGGVHERAFDRVLPAARHAAVLLRRALRRRRAPAARDLQQRPAARHLQPQVAIASASTSAASSRDTASCGSVCVGTSAGVRSTPVRRSSSPIRTR